MQAVARASNAVDSSARDCASMIRSSTVPNVKCGRMLHQICVCSTIELDAEQEIDVVGVRVEAAEVVGDAAPREHAGEDLGAGRVQAAEDAFREGRVGRRGQQHGQHRPQRVADGDGPVGPVDPHVHVDAEGVVPPRHVLQGLLHQAVVRRVDDALVLPGAPRMEPGRAERDPELRREPEEVPAALALALERVGEVLAPAGADLDLGGDQLTRDRVGQHVVLRRRARSAPRSG